MEFDSNVKFEQTVEFKFFNDFLDEYVVKKAAGLLCLFGPTVIKECQDLIIYSIL
jgi:hypothetical protein